MLIQRERVSRCSELSFTQKASSRVSCNHCCELNFDFPNETSDLYFTDDSTSTVPTHALASHERQLLCRTTRWSHPSPEFSLGGHLVLNRFLLVLD